MYVGVRWAGLVNHPHHRHKHCHTRWGQRTRTSVWIRDSLQQHSQATLSLREKPFSLPPSLDLHQHTHSHTHTPTAHYCSLSFPTSLSSLVMKQSRSEQGTQFVAPSLRLHNMYRITRYFCYGQASKFSTNIALGRMREIYRPFFVV